MSTKIRPKISKKNEYYISKHRYYELKHFCLQYREWKEKYIILDASFNISGNVGTSVMTSYISDKTWDAGMLRDAYRANYEMIEQTANEVDRLIGPYVFQAVTEDLTYDYLYLHTEIPCSRDLYYKVYRKFFWELDKKRI